jgi:redox-sensitive bicupin YhaK (pirin superfamily)
MKEKNLKKIESNIQMKFKPAFPGLRGIDIFAHQFPIEPFLVITEYFMSRPVFGPHPHAGISVMTYMLPDSQGNFINRDSNGDHSIIEPGGFHITQAGSGIHHDEFPEHTGVETHGFQIWINHSKGKRMVEPKAMHANATDVPIYESENKMVRVLLGSYEDKFGLHSLVTPLSLFHVTLKPNSSIAFDAEEMAFIYCISGKGEVAGDQVVGNSLVILSKSGSKVEIKSNEVSLDFLFASGKPINEPIVHGGPFVMTTEDQMNQTKKNFAAGKMGVLESYTG